MSKHERFKDADWTLKGDDLVSLRAIVDRFAPTDPISKLSSLFDNLAFDENDDLAAGNRHRGEAVRRLFDNHGPNALVQLAAEAKVSYLVIEATAQAGFREDEIEAIMVDSLRHDPSSAFSVGLSGLYRSVAGQKRADTWIQAIAQSASPAVVSALLQAWPDEFSTWNIVRRLGAPTIASYWQMRSPRQIKGTRRTLIYATLMYLRFGRAVEAIQTSLGRLSELPTKLIIRILRGVIPEINEMKSLPDTMTSFYVEKVFQELDCRSDVSVDDVVELEYSFLPLLSYNSNRSLRIQLLMAENPGFYHQILRTVFKGKDEPVREFTEDEKNRARRCYQLLTQFSNVPGCSNEVLDVNVLRAWIDEVRLLGSASDRVAVTDNFIGRLLAHAPVDADGGWPHKAVREELERLQSLELERGLQVERFNMRGVYGKEIFEGGAQERALAEQNIRWAEIAVLWPRTAALLRAIATSWSREAQREDIEAAQRKLRS